METQRRRLWSAVVSRERLWSSAAIVASTLAGQALVRRLLRRVAAVSTELTGINESDVYGQIGQRRDPGQITEMVGNINVTLDMLDQERQYASNVSHEVRSPLAGLRVELEEAQLHPELTDYPALIEHVLGCVDRMEAIATDLLLIARSHAAFAEREMIDLSELVRQEVLERTDPVPVEISCSPGVMVNAAPNQISEVLINLLDNAQRYAARSVQVQVDRAGDTATLAVSDDGKGIAEHDRERIFDRLVRLKAAPQRGGSGTGLGLAISREIAKAHHGSIRAEQSPSGGARFVVQLPVAG